MRAIMVMFDSLSKRMLPLYGGTETKADNFNRLADKSTVFNNFYAGSMPCMPARRELHTGRYNFLHRSWGPVEPFDDSMPEILRTSGVYTHIVSDHLHYWDDGGATYHRRYSSWECVRGQVADSWVGKVEDAEVPEHVPTMREFTHPRWWSNYWKNRDKIMSEDAYPQNNTFKKGLEFLEDNKDQDNWFLQIETFDPHEPFDVPQEFIDMYRDEYDGPFFNSPPYGVCDDSEEIVKHAQALYRALTSMCDRNLGKVLNFMDEHEMWEDTMLIVNTDHGLLVGERDWWAKSVMPCYNELVNIPFCLWDPRVKKTGKRDALAQTIDIAPTLLDFFGCKIPEDMQGKSLKPVVEDDTPVRDIALFGYAGSFINITDGKHVYMRASQTLGNKPLYEYTLMGTDRAGFMTNTQLRGAEMAPPFKFTKGCPVMKVPFKNLAKAPIFCNSFQYGNLLWDLQKDPGQESPLEDDALEAEFINKLMKEMKVSEAPVEQYERVGLDPVKDYKASDVADMKAKRATAIEKVLPAAQWEDQALTLFVALAGLMNDEQLSFASRVIKERLLQERREEVAFRDVTKLIIDDFKVNPEAARFLISKMIRIR